MCACSHFPRTYRVHFYDFILPARCGTVQCGDRVPQWFSTRRSVHMCCIRLQADVQSCDFLLGPAARAKEFRRPVVDCSPCICENTNWILSGRWKKKRKMIYFCCFMPGQAVSRSCNMLYDDVGTQNKYISRNNLFQHRRRCRLRRQLNGAERGCGRVKENMRRMKGNKKENISENSVDGRGAILLL